MVVGDVAPSAAVKPPEPRKARPLRVWGRRSWPGPIRGARRTRWRGFDRKNRTRGEGMAEGRFGQVGVTLASNPGCGEGKLGAPRLVSPPVMEGEHLETKREHRTRLN
jgi:hypothetical protein